MTLALTSFSHLLQYQDKHQRDWVIRRLYDIARLTGWQSARQVAEGCQAAWNKAAEKGRGEPYSAPEDLRMQIEAARATRPSIWHTGERRLLQRIRELQQSTEGADGITEHHQPEEAASGVEGEGNSDKKVLLPEAERAHYAVGLLAMEREFDKLDIQEDEDGRKGNRQGTGKGR